MEHEVFVPVASERLRRVLGDPSALARAFPGFQRDAGDEHPLAGRLKVRIGGSSVTYRGTARVTAEDDGSHLVEADGGEARGGGAVRLALTVRMREESGGTTLLFAGTVAAEGRIKEFDPETVHAAGVRLLNRFAGQLGEVAAPAEPGREGGPPAVPGTGEPLAGEQFEPLATGDFEASPDADDAPAPPVPPASAGPAGAGEAGQAEAEPTDDQPEEADEPPAVPSSPSSPSSPSVFDTEIPPSSLDPGQDADELAEDSAEDGAEGGEGAGIGAGGPEAAHARRTMIGRSAEEVDHAPPRGRYAPVPPPETAGVGTALRWAAPAAALALASAVVLTRILRRRR